MISIRHLYLCILISAILLVVIVHDHAHAAESKSTIVRTDVLFDPLFGVEYRPSEAHFDIPPDAIYRCKDLKLRRGNLFLFGDHSKGKTRYYYVYGWQEVEWDGADESVKHYEAESDDGIIVVISPKRCRDIGAGYAWSTVKSERKMAEKYGITDDVVSALIEDAIEREIRAFGGESNFFRRLAVAGVDESKLPVPIQKKLAAKRKKYMEKSPSTEPSK